MMKIYSLFMLLAFSFCVSAGEDLPFIVTKTFNIYVEEKCAEGELSCDNVIYRAVNKKNHQQITLKGHVVNVKPSMDFAGYEFDNGDYLYRLKPLREISESNEDKWSVMVFHKGKLIFTEDGISPDQ